METPQPPNNDSSWERKTLEKLVFAALDEQRAKRRWGIAFKILGFAYLLAVLIAVVDWGTGAEHQERHTAMVNLIGTIEAKGDASAENLVAALNSAFEEKNAVGIILRINSPGGSPVQAGLIYDEMKRLRAKYPDKPLYAVVEEVCASGGYYVAAAADKIYVDKASLIGSIGVIMNGFGFTEAMKKVGVERRLITAGDNKAFLDPFTEQNAYQTEFARQMAQEIHKQFIQAVKDGRGERLKSGPDTFSGLVWTGQTGVEMGLADELGSLEGVARDVLKAEDILDYTEQESFAERFAKRVGVQFASGMRSVMPSVGWGEPLFK